MRIGPTPTGPARPSNAGLGGQDANQAAGGLDGLNGIDGANGSNGIDGVPGANGIDSANGVDGANGIDTPNGIDGANGADQKANGLAGLDGYDGVDGFDGPDAGAAKAMNFVDGGRPAANDDDYADGPIFGRPTNGPSPLDALSDSRRGQGVDAVAGGLAALTEGKAVRELLDNLSGVGEKQGQDPSTTSQPVRLARGLDN